MKIPIKVATTTNEKRTKKLSNNNINNAVRGSHNWWQNVKTITGESKQTNQSEVINIAGEWLTSDQFVDKLNTYYVEQGDSTDINIPVNPLYQL